MRSAYERRKWWDKAKPTQAWAERYGNQFADVEKFVSTSAYRAVVLRYAIVFLVFVAIASVMATVVVNSFWIGEKAQRERLTSDLARVDAKLTEVTLQGRQVSAELTQVLNQKKELDQTILQLRSTMNNDKNSQQDLENLIKQSDNSSDNVTQRAIVDPKKGRPELSAETGYMWIGPVQGGNLVTVSGDPVPPRSAQINGEYLTTLDIYLRQGLPDRTTYVQAAQTGIMPEGTRIQILSVAPPFPRPTGDQYWGQVKVVKMALSTVYFQFAGGARDQAQQLSKALQDKGYKIPGEERTGAAAGKREVRYFYAGQKTIADQLATDTTQALQRLGYPSLQVSTAFAGAPTKSNPDGKLELWLEIPPK
jgi:hypothetical protein